MLERLAEQSRRCEGGLRYDVFQENAPRTNHFTVYAVWSSTNAFAAHEGHSGTRQFREAAGPMLGALYDERLYRRLSIDSLRNGGQRVWI